MGFCGNLGRTKKFQQLFATILSYGLNRLPRQIYLAFKFSFFNLHYHGFGHRINHQTAQSPARWQQVSFETSQ